MINVTQFKESLSSERMKLLSELSKYARINPDNQNDWEPIAGNLNAEQAEAEERAGEITDFEERSAIEYELEKQLHDVDDALVRIEKEEYGLCAVCKGEIEEERLLVNLAAKTCKAHME